MSGEAAEEEEEALHPKVAKKISSARASNRKPGRRFSADLRNTLESKQRDIKTHKTLATAGLPSLPPPLPSPLQKKVTDSNTRFLTARDMPYGEYSEDDLQRWTQENR